MDRNPLSGGFRLAEPVDIRPTGSLPLLGRLAVANWRSVCNVPTMKRYLNVQQHHFFFIKKRKTPTLKFSIAN